MFSQGGAKKVGPSGPDRLRQRSLNSRMLSQGQLPASSSQLPACTSENSQNVSPRRARAPYRSASWKLEAGSWKLTEYSDAPRLVQPDAARADGRCDLQQRC